MSKKKTIRKISSSVLSNRIEKALAYLINPRVKDIVERRFGIKTGNPQTLEAIGQSYNITRERVRQIQDTGLKILKSEKVIPLFVPLFSYLDKLFADHGHIMGEEYLYSTATGIEEAHPFRGQLYLVLTLGEPYQRIINDEYFHPYWIADSSAPIRARQVADSLIDHFNKQKRLFSELEILNLFNEKHSDLPRGMFYVVLDIAREIDKNPFEEIGLSHWPEISPQGVKDRAYIVLKRQGKPLHFTEITDLINKSFADRPAYPQTVHNEVIKNPRFVLVGRGMYGLTEWGYEPGTVEEIIEKILRKVKRPMTQKEILEAVLAQRQVKPTTVVINLQRSSKTQRLPDGRFALV